MFRLAERLCLLFFFFFNDTATTEIYTLSLHDALPISRRRAVPRHGGWPCVHPWEPEDRKSTRLNSSHTVISYAVFCLKKKKQQSHQKRNTSKHKDTTKQQTQKIKK